MGLKIIRCGRQTVRVIRPDGQIRQFLLPIKVSDLLLLHPHHYVSPANNSKRKSAILPLDTHLESGGIYILLPLPRLFPCSSSYSSPCYCSCSCFQDLFLNSEIVLKRQWSIVGPSGQPVKISSRETVLAGKPRRVWEPALEVISENRLLLRTKEEEQSAVKEKKNKNGPAADKKSWIFYTRRMKS